MFANGLHAPNATSNDLGPDLQHPRSFSPPPRFRWTSLPGAYTTRAERAVPDTRVCRSPDGPVRPFFVYGPTTFMAGDLAHHLQTEDVSDKVSPVRRRLCSRRLRRLWAAPPEGMPS